MHRCIDLLAALQVDLWHKKVHLIARSLDGVVLPSHLFLNRVKARTQAIMDTLEWDRYKQAPFALV